MVRKLPTCTLLQTEPRMLAPEQGPAPPLASELERNPKGHEKMLCSCPLAVARGLPIRITAHIASPRFVGRSNPRQAGVLLSPDDCIKGPSECQDNFKTDLTFSSENIFSSLDAVKPRCWLVQSSHWLSLPPSLLFPMDRAQAVTSRTLR